MKEHGYPEQGPVYVVATAFHVQQLKNTLGRNWVEVDGLVFDCEQMENKKACRELVQKRGFIDEL